MVLRGMSEVKVFKRTLAQLSLLVSSANFNKTTTEKYYTVDGRQIQKLQKGLNIIESSDGTTRKCCQVNKLTSKRVDEVAIVGK